MRQLLLDFTQAPAPTFENFVHGGNAELFHALTAAANGNPADRVIYMWGEPGCGKTHLARAFEAATAGRPGYRVVDEVLEGRRGRLGEVEEELPQMSEILT